MNTEFQEPSSVLSTKTQRATLYLGNRKTAESLTRLQELQITHVVNAAPIHVKPSEQMKQIITYLECDLKDAPKVVNGKVEFDDVNPYINQATEFIAETLQNGNNVLVHCAGGISRSATLVLAFLMNYSSKDDDLPMTLADGFKLLKKVRPVIAPNAGFMRQLIAIEKELFGESTIEDPISDHQRDFNIKS